jgi:hypothetical protein
LRAAIADFDYEAIEKLVGAIKNNYEEKRLGAIADLLSAVNDFDYDGMSKATDRLLDGE